MLLNNDFCLELFRYVIYWRLKSCYVSEGSALTCVISTAEDISIAVLAEIDLDIPVITGSNFIPSSTLYQILSRYWNFWWISKETSDVNVNCFCNVGFRGVVDLLHRAIQISLVSDSFSLMYGKCALNYLPGWLQNNFTTFCVTIFANAGLYISQYRGNWLRCITDLDV